MRCPYCADPANRVIDSRLGRDGSEIRRRRECLECGRRFTTRERVDEVLPKVVKRDDTPQSLGMMHGSTIRFLSEQQHATWGGDFTGDEGPAVIW